MAAVSCFAAVSSLTSCGTVGGGGPDDALLGELLVFGAEIAAEQYPEAAEAIRALSAVIREVQAESPEGIESACADCLASRVENPQLRALLYRLIDRAISAARNAQERSENLETLADALDDAAAT